MKIIGAASVNHEKQMRALGEFCGVDSIRYEDLGDTEKYFLMKGGKELTIKACYNRIDKGFLAIEAEGLWDNIRQNRGQRIP